MTIQCTFFVEYQNEWIDLNQHPCNQSSSGLELNCLKIQLGQKWINQYCRMVLSNLSLFLFSWGNCTLPCFLTSISKFRIEFILPKLRYIQPFFISFKQGTLELKYIKNIIRWISQDLSINNKNIIIHWNKLKDSECEIIIYSLSSAIYVNFSEKREDSSLGHKVQPLYPTAGLSLFVFIS